MKLKAKITLLLISINLAGAGLFAYISYSSHRDLIAIAKEQQMASVATFIQNDIQEQSTKAAARASLVCNLGEVKEAFRAQDRDLLAKRLVPAFLIQRDKYGAREGQFHLPPATSFLRLFDLKSFGEDLSGFREMVLTTNRRQEPQKGVEIGRRGLSIRGVDLAKDEQGPIGSFEIGISFATVTADIKRNTGFESGAFVDDKLMSAIATEIPRPDSEHIIGGYQAVETTNWELVRGMASPDLLSRANDIAYRLELHHGVEYGLVLVPLLDFKGTQIGSIVAVGSLETLQTQLKAALVSILSNAGLLAVFLSGVSLVAVNLVLVRPILAVREALEHLSQGKDPAGLKALPETGDELGSIRKSIRTIREARNEQPAKSETILHA